MLNDPLDSDPPSLGSEQLAATAERAKHLRRRRNTRWMAAVTAVLAAGGATAIALRGSDDQAQSQPPTATADPAGSTSAPTQSTAAPTVVSTTVADAPVPVAPELAELTATIRERARSVASFSAHVVHTKEAAGTEDLPPTEYDVVLAADGAMWATDQTGGWMSYDPSTGVSRTAARPNADAELRYEETVGVNWNSADRVLGHDPVEQFDQPVAPGYRVVVTEDTVPELDDLSVWRVEIDESSRPELGDVETSHLRYDIDQATGLIVTYEVTHSRRLADGSTTVSDRSTSRFTSFEIGTPLPTEFPGIIPDSAAVERWGDPAEFTGALTEADLAEAFGPGFLVPDSAADRSQLELVWPDDGTVGLPAREPGSVLQVTFTWRHGFDQMTATVGKSATADPVGVEPLTTVGGGVLDGLPIYRTNAVGLMVVANLEGQAVFVIVSGGSVEEAAELLASFRQPLR